MSVLGLQLRTPGNRSRFGTLTRSRRLSGNSMLRPSRGSNCPSPVRRNSNALTEVDAEPSLARFPIARSGMRRSRPQPDMTREASFAHTCTTGDCERPGQRQSKNAASASQTQSVEHQTLHLRSRRRDDEPTPAFFQVVELGAESACVSERRSTAAGNRAGVPSYRTPRNGLRDRQALVTY